MNFLFSQKEKGVILMHAFKNQANFISDIYTDNVLQKKKKERKKKSEYTLSYS